MGISESNQRSSGPIFASEAFLASEGDAYFRRIRETRRHLESQDSEVVKFILSVLKLHSSEICKVLEIGSSDGRKLEAICDSMGSQGVGVDPSLLAVEEGNARFELAKKPLKLIRGVANNLGLAAQEFDLVILGFFLYLEDRANLLFSLAEADRVLRPGGFLAVWDFNPGTPGSKDYSHQSGIRTYKNYYPGFFTALSHYVEVAKLPLTSSLQIGFELNPGDRHELTILWKKQEPYPEN